MANQNRCYNRCWFRICMGMVACWLLVHGFTTMAQTGQPVGRQSKPLVIIDPGHGGPDPGVSGAAGATEKAVTFALARKIQAQLSPDCRVRLTRTGDYRVNEKERASIANHHQGHLFVSLHTGGGFRRVNNHWAVYYRPPDGTQTPQLQPEVSPRKWHRLQDRHARAAAAVAETLKKHLEAGLEIGAVETTPAPLAVLSGVDMPAVVIETGYLTHPPQARFLTDDKYRAEVARAVADGIVGYLEKK